MDAGLLNLARGADVFVYDAQYTPEEYAGTGALGGSKRGWGHSTFEEGARIAKAAGARQLVLFHHDPMQSDSAVREKEKRARVVFPNAIAAYEGLSIDV